MKKQDYNFTADEFNTLCNDISNIYGVSKSIYESLENKAELHAVLIRGIEGLSQKAFSILLSKEAEKCGE